MRRVCAPAADILDGVFLSLGFRENLVQRMPRSRSWGWRHEKAFEIFLRIWQTLDSHLPCVR